MKPNRPILASSVGRTLTLVFSLMAMVLQSRAQESNPTPNFSPAPTTDAIVATNAATGTNALADTDTTDAPVPVLEMNPEPWPGPEMTEGMDLIELTSGEWLKGEIQMMYNDWIEFDSDILDLQKIDWTDVRQLISTTVQTVRTDDKKQYYGRVRINEENVDVIGMGGITNTFPRSDLLAILEGEPKEINFWSFKAGLGITLQRGNTKQTDVNLSARIRRQTTATRINLEYLGLGTEVDDVETANNHRATFNYDIYLTRRLFLRPVFAEYYRDHFQNIDHQLLVGFGVGYTIIDTSRTDWDVFAGPAYQYTRFVSVEPGEPIDVSTPALVVGTSYEVEITSWMDADASYRFSVMNKRSGTYKHHATAGLEIELTDALDLDVSVVWDRIQDPQPRDDGTVPKQDDFRFILGVSVDL